MCRNEPDQRPLVRFAAVTAGVTAGCSARRLMGASRSHFRTYAWIMKLTVLSAPLTRSPRRSLPGMRGAGRSLLAATRIGSARWRPRRRPNGHH
jgi:hypothetical protein